MFRVLGVWSIGFLFEFYSPQASASSPLNVEGVEGLQRVLPYNVQEGCGGSGC